MVNITVHDAEATLIVSVSTDNQHPRNVDGFIAYRLGTRLPKTSTPVAILKANGDLEILSAETIPTPAAIDAAASHLYETSPTPVQLRAELAKFDLYWGHCGGPEFEAAKENASRKVVNLLSCARKADRQSIYDDALAGNGPACLDGLKAWSAASTHEERVAVSMTLSNPARILILLNPAEQEAYVRAFGDARRKARAN